MVPLPGQSSQSFIHQGSDFHTFMKRTLDYEPHLSRSFIHQGSGFHLLYLVPSIAASRRLSLNPLFIKALISTVVYSGAPCPHTFRSQSFIRQGCDLHTSQGAEPGGTYAHVSILYSSRLSFPLKEQESFADRIRKKISSRSFIHQGSDFHASPCA